MSLPPLAAEWLEADGAGGFASGTVAGYRTRRYHAFLLAATALPSGRVALVNGIEAFVRSGSATWPLSTQHYGPDVLYPRGLDGIASFAAEPWPTWTFRGPEGTTITQEIMVARDRGDVLLAWRRTGGTGPARLVVRPLLSGRDYHALMHENPGFDFTARVTPGNVRWRPYAGLPAVVAVANGAYDHATDWYRNFRYADEAARGLDCTEDLAAPGTFTFDLGAGEAVLVLRAGEPPDADPVPLASDLRAREAARRGPMSTLDRAAEQYLVRRGDGHTIVAGYPWFTDWGRDTFVAMRGLVLARGRFDLAASILTVWAQTASEGMLPNRFPDQGAVPEYNAVDASLWFVIVVHEYLALVPASPARAQLVAATQAILDGHVQGTRYGIRLDDDGLLACGAPGVQLTWMDARVGARVVTPRIGKPVEVQALWYNALRLAGGRFAAVADRAALSFRARFATTDGGLYDVVDADHVSGRVDASVRPNQIFAVGGLPFALVDGALARTIVATVERSLLTPLGLRTLAPDDPHYAPHYEGDGAQRDGAYHQGTAWPWLMGAFVDAWMRVNGDDDAHRQEARRRFVAPLDASRDVRGLGHVSEIADGDPPHTLRGCPFQAWSLSELIRAQQRTAPR